MSGILRWLCIACLFTVSALSHTASARDRKADIGKLAEAFAAPDTYSLPSLSPSGRYLAVLETKKTASVVVFDLENPEKPKKIFEIVPHKMGGEPLLPQLYNRFLWLDDSRLFIDLVASFRIGDCRVPYKCQRYADTMFKVVDLKQHKLISPFEKGFSPYGNQTSVVNWPDQPGDRVLLALSESTERSISTQYADVFEIDPVTLKTSEVFDRRDYVWSWMVDNAGDLRVYWERPPSQNDKVFFRLDGDKKWNRLSKADKEPGKTFAIFGFSPEANKIYVSSNHEAEPAALYLFDLTTETFEKKIIGHDKYDISSVVLFPNGEIETVIAGDNVLLDSEKNIAAREKMETLKNADRLYYYGGNFDDTRRLFALGSSDDPGQFYLAETADISNVKLTPLFERRTKAKKVAYAHTKEITIKAHDGLELEGYLSVPAGHDVGKDKPIPFVVMPHGGPWSRDFNEFDSVGQFVNALGIGVIKVNFRGSAGYGAQFEELGVGQWGKAMQDDLNSAHQYLLDNNLAQSDRICMVGWSYGGYASLLAAIRDGDKYKCAVSIAGVSDISALLRSDPGDEIIRRLGAKSQFDHGAVREISPIEHVEKISIPVLLAHGTADNVVPYEDQYLPILKKMRAKGKDVDYIAFKYGDHSLSSALDRQILFIKLGLFLDEQLKPKF